ncbi:hypothetical protein CMV14_12705 [Rhizorhabdus dicambivorans]|nr:hypothetical protein CMV14_12705 [Rhizorhabdus dicambivorans]
MTADAAAPDEVAPSGRSTWATALERYRMAASAYAAFVETRLKPAQAVRDSSTGGGHSDCFRLEDEATDLLVTQLDQMEALAATPAPNLLALRTKLEIVYADVCRHEPDRAELVANILADARRLIKM